MKPGERLTEFQIRDYSKKIFGFALRKTGNHHHAEDLTQEILVSLLSSIQSGRIIDRMDAWVYRICCYTWSNYVSKEKRYWRTSDISDLELQSDARSPEDEYGLKEELERLSQEVRYLSQLHRDISVLFYYENQSIKTISSLLQIPQGTVKWHLSEARKKIKEGLTMDSRSTDTLSLKPVRLNVGHCGSPGPQGEPNSYFDTLLASNICIAAYERPVTIEEIARSLGVSSAYIEDFIGKFEFSELIRKVGKSTFQTNFIIQDMKSNVAIAGYLKTKAEELADDFYSCLASKLDELKGLGFHGSQCGDTFLLWAIIPYAINHQYFRVKDQSYYAQYQPDERKDGGKYILQARIRYEEQDYQLHLPEPERTKKYVTNGIKSRSTGKYSALQMETWWSGLKWRDFNAPDIVDMHRIVELIETGAEHTEYDKELISRMVKKGFVSYREGRLECLIPFFKPEQFHEFIRIIETALQEVDAKRKLEQVHDDFVELWEKLAPRHIAKKEIVYKAYQDGSSIIFAMLENMEHSGKLPLPAEEEKERLTTLMWMHGPKLKQ
jgi:RNA polymerase sigma factor (sigma-70 family)